MDIFIVFLSVIQCRVYIRFTIIESMLALFPSLLALLKITDTWHLMLCALLFAHATPRASLKYFFSVVLIHPRILPAPILSITHHSSVSFLWVFFFFSSFSQIGFVWLLVMCIASRCYLVAAIVYENFNYLPAPPAAYPISVFGPQSINVLDHNLLPAYDLPKYSAFGGQFISPTSFIGTVKSPADNFDDTLLGYYHNGRYLKQYFVMENDFDDLNGLNNFLNRLGPFVPNSYNIPAASSQPNLGFPAISPAPPPPQPSYSALQTAPQTFTNSPSINGLFQSARSSAVPVQLGSGSLGYIRLPNGAVFLGSGSLGYVNDQQKVNQLSEIQSRQSPQASPVTFGEAPR